MGKTKFIGFFLIGPLLLCALEQAYAQEPESEVEVESEATLTGTSVSLPASLESEDEIDIESSSQQHNELFPAGGLLLGEEDAGSSELLGDVRKNGESQWEISASIAGESRVFFDRPANEGQLEHWQTSLIFEAEIEWWSEDESHRILIEPFFRLDEKDYRRTHFDLREAYYRRNEDNWVLTAGVSKVFWGVTESRHLVDIINQDDYVEDVDREDKLGQPMLNLKFLRDWGTVDFFVLPYFREQPFPGRAGRLRPPLPVSDDATYESSAGGWSTDFALRYSHVIGDFDFGLYYFHGTGREPTFDVNADFTELTPHYDIINQTAVDFQYTRGAWLWKLEALLREGQGDTFAATVAGFEYTLYQIAETSADLGILSEYLWDGRDDTAPVTTTQNDLFLGARLALNDSQDTALLAGTIFDMESSAASAFVEFERRLGAKWFFELEARFVLNGEQDPGLKIFANDSFLTLRLARHF